MENLTYNKLFWMTKFRMLLLILVIVGAYNWGAEAYGYNFVDLLATKVNPDGSLHINKIIYILVALSALVLALRRDTWLPFLGCTAIPSSLLPLKSPPNNANITVKVQVRPKSKVVYWAAYGNDSNQDVSVAYNDFSNSGVVMSDSDGNAILSIIEGGGYHVPFRTISRHIHYRVFSSLGNMLGPVRTVYY